MNNICIWWNLLRFILNSCSYQLSEKDQEASDLFDIKNNFERDIRQNGLRSKEAMNGDLEFYYD